MLSTGIGCLLSGAAAPRGQANVAIPLQPSPAPTSAQPQTWTSINGDSGLAQWCNANCASGFCPVDKCVEEGASDELLVPSPAPSPKPTATSKATTKSAVKPAVKSPAKSTATAKEAAPSTTSKITQETEAMAMAENPPDTADSVDFLARSTEAARAHRSCAPTPADAPLYCGVTGKEQPIRIATGFYGVHRSTALTVESIRENLLKPLEEVGAVDVFVHAIIVTELEDGTHVKQEAGVELCPNDYLLLRACVSSTTAQHDVDNKHHLKAFAKAGVWESAETVGFRNLTGPFPRVVPPAIADEGVRLNMLRSRFSMQQVGRLIVKHEKDIGAKYTHIVLARPDVGLVSPLIWKPPPVHVQGVALHAKTMWMRVPNMQHYYGLNDRLAYGSRDAMLYVSNEVRRRPPRPPSNARPRPARPLRSCAPFEPARALTAPAPLTSLPPMAIPRPSPRPVREDEQRTRSLSPSPSLSLSLSLTLTSSTR